MANARIVVAGAQSTHVAQLVGALNASLPPSISAVIWDASASQHAEDIVLLLGLQHPQSEEEARDGALRQFFVQRGVAFQVLYGESESLIEQARHAISRSLRSSHPELAQALMREEMPPRWQGVCESCSDPDCEHRLFRRLLSP